MIILRNIGAVLAALIIVVVLSVGTDALITWSGLFPAADTPLMLTFALVYRGIYTLLGGYVCAALAASRRMHIVLILGLIGLLASIGGVVAGWSLGNQWYPIVLAVTALPLTLLGGKLRKQ